MIVKNPLTMNATHDTNEIPDIGPEHAAEILKVTSRTIRNWMKSGRLKAVMVGGRFRTKLEWIEETIMPVAVANIGGQDSEDNKQKVRDLVKALFGHQVLGSELHREV